MAGKHQLSPREGQVEKFLMRDPAAVDSCPVWNSKSFLGHTPRLASGISAAGGRQLREYRHPQTCQLHEPPPCPTVIWGPLIGLLLLITI